VDISIHFNDQRRFVAVEINNESRYNLLPPKTDAQLPCADFFLQKFLGRSHLTAKFFGSLEFFFSNFLICDDVL
jgi:hypothetical protein